MTPMALLMQCITEYLYILIYNKDELTMITINYNRRDAVNYANKWALSRNPAFYDYSNIGGDCTNFASQVVYAGTGVMNYTPDTGWYYINANDKSPSWTGVQFFYDFMINNEGIGPFAEERDLRGLLPGDLVQFGDANGNFYHTVVITDILRFGNRRVYLVASHSADSYRRNLATYDFENYRGIHILGARVEDDYFA